MADADALSWPGLPKARWILLLSVALLLVSLGNGAVSYLKRVGVIEPQIYAKAG